MTTHSRRWRVGRQGIALALCLSASLGACKTAGFRRVFVALDEQGDRKRTTFFTDTGSVFCVGELVSGRTDVTVQAILKVKTLDDASSHAGIVAPSVTALGESAPGKTDGAFVAFDLQGVLRGDGRSADLRPYPVGTFSCELLIDGEVEDSVDFAIAFAPCPALPPVSGQSCKGWVRSGSQCAGVGSGACTCDGESGAWQCD